MLKKTILSILMIVLCCISGCTVVNPEKTEELLEKDPSFKQVLDGKRQIDDKILSLKNELRNKKNTANSKIATLRKEFREEKTRAHLEIRGLKRQFDPQRKLISDERGHLKKEIKEKEITLRNIERTIRDLDKLMSKEGALNITREEVTRWHQRIKALEDDKKRIKKDIKDLKEELRIAETKLRLLRQF